MRIPDSRFAASCIAVVGAVLAIGVSATINVQFAYDMGAAHSRVLAWAFAAGALAATLLAASMPACATAAFARLDIARGTAAIVLWAAAVAFSGVAAIGAAAVARSDLASIRAKDAGTQMRGQLEHARLTAELDRIAPARPAARSARPLVGS